MTLILVLLFLIVFGLIILAINVGSQFLESQKKKKVTEMLQTASGSAVQTQAKVLMEPMDIYPQRFRVSEFPTDEQFAGMGATRL